MTHTDSVRRPIASVIGSARPSLEDEQLAFDLGRLLVDHGFRIVTGGLAGVMAAASRGARSSRLWVDGTIIGILPTYDAADANPWVDIAIPTGMNHARNALVVSAGDIVIAIGGGAGTLSELGLAWSLGKGVIIVGDGGWAPHFAGVAIDSRRSDVAHAAATAADACQLAVQLAGRSEAPSDEFPL